MEKSMEGAVLGDDEYLITSTVDLLPLSEFYFGDGRARAITMQAISTQATAV